MGVGAGVTLKASSQSGVGAGSWEQSRAGSETEVFRHFSLSFPVIFPHGGFRIVKLLAD